MFFLVGYLYNDNNIAIISDGKRYFALYGWNGLSYCDCWEVSNEDGFDPIDANKKYYFGPIYLEKENLNLHLEPIGFEENEESKTITLFDLKKIVNEAEQEYKGFPSADEYVNNNYNKVIYGNCSAELYEFLKRKYQILKNIYNKYSNQDCVL